MDDEIERAVTLSLAASHVSRPENDRSSERLSDTGLREALEASLRDAQEDDSATQRAIELAMAESLKHDDGDAPQHPDLDLGASGQGSCIEQPIDLASAPTDGSGALLPQVTAASAAPAPSSSADGNDAPPVFGSLSADEEAAVFRSLGATSFGSDADDPPPPAFGSLAPPPDDGVPMARPVAVHQPSSSFSAPAPPSEPSRGWVCVCAPDEMAHVFAREAFLVPAALRATAGMAQPGEPLFLLSKLDGMLRGGFEVKRGPQQAHEDGSASVPFTVVREALLEFAVPLETLGGSGLLDVLGEHTLGSLSCLELELWQADAIQGLLEDMAAQAHAGEHGAHTGTADPSATLGDEEIARALHEEMEQEIAREARLEAERRARVEEEERRVALMLAVKHEAEARAQELEAQELEAMRLEAEEERLRQEEEQLRRTQEDADAARALELQAQFDNQANTQAAAQAHRDAAAAQAMQAQFDNQASKQEDADAAHARSLAAQFDNQANERMEQQLADEQQARALHVALRAEPHPAGANACAPCAPSHQAP